MLSVELKTDRETKKLLKDMPKMVRKGLKKAMTEVMEDARKTAQKSFGQSGKPKDGPKQLLRKSIKSSAKIAGNVLSGQLFSDAIYARIIEEGGTIRGKTGPLTFPIGGSWRSPLSVKIPARPYLRPAIADHLSEIEETLTDGVWEEFER